MSLHLDEIALAVTSNMTMCINQKLDTSIEYVMSMINVFEDTLVDLMATKEEASHCFDNIDGVQSFAKAVICSNKVGSLDRMKVWTWIAISHFTGYA